MPGNDVNILELDLNLLTALDALLSERSVTKAAELLGRSQPALSASLKRLRRQFRDELLVRVGNHYELTPLATQMRSRVGLLISDAERLFGMRASFDAVRSTREFVVVTSDYGLSVLGFEISRLLATAAPSVRIRFVPISDTMVDTADRSLRGVDGMLLPHGYLKDLPHLDTHEDRWVCLVARDHPCGEMLTPADLNGSPWVLTFTSPGANLPAVRQLQMMGVEMRTTVAVETFLGLPAFIVGTDRIALIQEKLASRLVKAWDVRAVECPYELVPLVEAFWWHPTLDQDPGHVWFREVVHQAARRIV